MAFSTIYTSPGLMLFVIQMVGGSAYAQEDHVQNTINLKNFHVRATWYVLRLFRSHDFIFKLSYVLHSPRPGFYMPMTLRAHTFL